jgi:cold shock CspA family protein
MTGTITFWNAEKAFGFIRPDELHHPDLFMHIKFCKLGFHPEQNDRVSFDVKEDPKRTGKLMAVDVQAA